MKRERKIFLIMGGLDYEPSYVIAAYTTKESALIRVGRLEASHGDTHYFYIDEEVLKGELG